MQNHHKHLLTLFFIFLIFLGIGYSLNFPDRVGLCNHTEFLCLSQYPVFEIGQPLFKASQYILISLLLLIPFSGTKIFTIWLKFFIPFLLASVIIVFLAPITSRGGLDINLFAYDKSIAVFYLGWLLVIVTVGIILYQKYKRTNQRM